ncbi:MAG: iron-sulfur cluster repair di-iron protein [Fimbriimonadaceae bacterium]|nr:iron-sulfur cluster repair di-iron protein [Fimbriimonadaceae bacterium]
MSTSTFDRPVCQLVAEKPSRSRVFERWGIDYCCGGKKILSEVCASKNLDLSEVTQDLEASDSGPQPSGTDWTKESLTALSDHIQSVHHHYLTLALPRLTMLTERVAERHAKKDPRLVELSHVFADFRSEMEVHTGKEDQILFPAIRSLEEPGQENPVARGIAQPISVMLADHDAAGAALVKMKELTDGFEPSPDACNTHRAMLDALAELEAETHQHVHLENNILFPRAIEKASSLA